MDVLYRFVLLLVQVITSSFGLRKKVWYLGNSFFDYSYGPCKRVRKTKKGIDTKTRSWGFNNYYSVFDSIVGIECSIIVCFKFGLVQNVMKKLTILFSRGYSNRFPQANQIWDGSSYKENSESKQRSKRSCNECRQRTRKWSASKNSVVYRW